MRDPGNEVEFHSWSTTFSHLATEKKCQSPVGACLKKFISDPVKLGTPTYNYLSNN